MKTRSKMLKSIVALYSCLALTSALSQSVYVWTNQNPQQLQLSPPPADNHGNGDLNQGTNWTRVAGPGTGGTDANGQPRPDFQDGVTWGDEMQFNGQTIGPVIATQDGGFQANGAGSGQTYGLHVHLTANQTAPVTVYTRANGASGGMRMNSFQMDAGAGQFSLGSNSVTGVLDIIGGVQNGQICTFTNNSTTPGLVNPDVRYRMGGAGSHPFIFAGTGDWIVNNHMRSANQSSIQVQKFGPGTMTWIGTNVGLQSANWGDQLGTPIIIGEGTMIWKTSDLVSAPGSGSPNIVNNATWKYDVQPIPGLVTGAGQVLGNISGGGTFEIHAGTLTFGGANTFSGNINLTGGELIAGSTENVGASGPLGQAGIISFNGGTLGWSLANAFDYSSRFSSAPGQLYNLDTGGASPTLATGLSSSGGILNKTGGGTLTLAGASTYTGPTTIGVNGGIVFQGTKSGNADITVADTGTLGVFENDSQITPNTLTLGTSTGATLEFNNVTNHTLATLAPNNLVAAGTVTINVNSGRFILIGETFPLLKWTSGPAPATTLGFLAGAGGHLTTNGNQINVVIDNPPYIWTGAISAIWDTTTINWVRNALPATWVNGNFALLDDSSIVTNIALTGIITPTNATINSSEPYAITNSPGNVLGGGGGLTKSGSGTLLLPGGANTYTGITTLGGGILDIDVLANGGLPSDIGAASSAAVNIVLSGGTLLYTGPASSIDRLFTVGPGGGTIDNESVSGGQLAFTNTGSLGMSGNGPRTLTLTGPGFGGGDTLACNVTNHPAGTSLTKSGAGLWILTGTNTYAGGTTLLQGSLQIGTGGPGGAIGNGDISTAAGTTIDFQHGGTNTLLVPGSIDGGASVSLNSTGTVVLANNNGYTGGTTINSGALQVGNGTGTGSLFVNGAIVNNSLLVFNTAGSFTYQAAGLISGSGNVIFQGGGLIKAVGANSYSGWTRIDANTTFFCREGQDGALATSAITNNGTLRIVDQNNPGFSYGGLITGSGRVQIGNNNANVGVMTLTGTNSYTGGTFIGGNTLVLGDGTTTNAGSLSTSGTVQFVNNFTIALDNPRTLIFNRPEDFVFPNNIVTNFSSPQGNLGIVQQNGVGALTLTGNNTYGGGTVVNAGSLIIGNGGSSGSVGFGPVALNSLNPLVINRTGNLTIWGNISGAADVLLKGGATVTLNGANNSYTGVTTVSNGTLIVNGTNLTASTHVYVGGFGGSGTLSGQVVLEPGTAVVANGQVAPLTINNDFTNDASAMVFEINKLASPANDSVIVSGALARNATGGTLTVKNLGPNNLVPGDTFTLFSQPLPNGASITVTGARANWVNNLAVNGSISVASLITTQPTLNIGSVTTTNLQFSWSDPYNSFKLQAKTNSVTTNWVDYPGGGTSPITVPINKANGSVFYRLVSIP